VIVYLFKFLFHLNFTYVLHCNCVDKYNVCLLVNFHIVVPFSFLAINAKKIVKILEIFTKL
jgi:hypothetical protein